MFSESNTPGRRHSVVSKIASSEQRVRVPLKLLFLGQLLRLQAVIDRRNRCTSFFGEELRAFSICDNYVTG
jgi:hypothetical protein